MIDKVCVVSGAQLEKANNGYRSRFGFVQYLEELSDYFEKVRFFAPIRSDKNRYNSVLSPDVEVIEVSYSPEKSLPRKLITSTLYDFREAWNLFDSNTGVIVFYPCTWAVFMLPAIWLKSGRYLGYFGNDPEEFIASAGGNDFRRNWGKQLFYRILHSIWVADADALLARGKDTYDQLLRSGKPVYETKPLLGLSAEDVFAREDTCNGSMIRLLYVGGLYGRKGLNYLLESLEMLIDADLSFNLELTIVGEGEEREGLERTVEELDLAQYVDFVGYVDEKEKLLSIYRYSDVFVLPSVAGEGFPRVIDEAMASSMPVIVTDSGSISAELNNNTEAVIVDPRDPKALADGIVKIVNNTTLRKRLIRNGKKRVMDEISPTAAKQHAEIIMEIGS